MAGTTHRFKVEGKGRIKAYSCSCGNWGMTGSEKHAKSIRASHAQHAEKGGLAAAGETPKADPGDAGGSGSDSGSEQ